MITFDKDKNRFNFRVAAVAMYNDKILLHRYEGFDFWALPGGRAEFQETSAETIIREMKEELDEVITVDRMLWCHESFFSHFDKDFHEICFMYLIDFEENSKIYDHKDEFEQKELDGSILTFKWFNISDINSLKIYPEFLKDKITNIPDTMEHIVSKR